MADRALALDLGARAERVMRCADRMAVVPGPYALDELRRLLEQANAADPDLPDPWWDRAVIEARYLAAHDAARQHLQTALAAGLRHPMVPALLALIEARAPAPPVVDDADSRLHRLLLDFAAQAESPLFEPLLRDEGPGLAAAAAPTPRPATFGAYEREAKALCADTAPSEDAAERALAAAHQLSGDAREYMLDLLRRIAPGLGHEPLTRRATEAHLRAVVEQAYAIFARQPQAARRSRRAAERGLAILATAPWLQGSDLHADLLIARGQALYDDGSGREVEAMQSYQQALRIKRAVGNVADAERLVTLLRRQVQARIGRAVLGGVVGIEAGRAAEALRACVEVVDELDDAALAAATRLAHADLLHALGRREEAEDVLRDLLASDPPADTAWGARFTLASICAETQRPREAAALQRALIAEAGGHDAGEQSVLWSNHANSLRLCGDLDGAQAALDRAWDLLPPERKVPPPGQLAGERVRLKLLYAQLAQERGDLRAALAYADEAVQAQQRVGVAFGLDAVRATELRAGVLLASGNHELAAQTLDAAAQNLRAILARGQDFPTWEGLFRRWSSLDAMAVQAHLGRAGGAGRLDALLRAEAAKGRVLRWLATRDPQAGAAVLDPQRQRDALQRAQAWLAADPGRRLLSLYAGQHGLGIVVLRHGAEPEGGWLDDVDYSRLREDVYLPFEATVDAALRSGSMSGVRVASALLEHLLSRLGTALWRVAPSLAEGGSELAILPHRLLRALPLAQAMLPSGRRLSELYASVWTTPSLDLAFPAADAPAPVPRPAPVRAAVDPDGSLAFAVCEALAVADADRICHGAAATSAALTDVLGRPDIALVSMHGAFDAGDPFSHRIVAADRAVELRDFVLQGTPVHAPLVLLGVCEAGLQRQSVSDEPIGYPTLLLQAGALAVVAPLWKVDDFASLHFVTRFLGEVLRGVPVPQAACASAAWMREATPNEVIAATDAVLATVRSRLPADDTLWARIDARLDAQQRWLLGLPRHARPFGQAVDWAAFQLTRRVPVYLSTEA